MLDLICGRDPNMVDNVQVNGSFHTSDHKLLSYKEAEDTTEIKYDYKKKNEHKWYSWGINVDRMG